MPPARLLAGYRGARKVVELASGPRFDEALQAARALPGCEVVVTDVDPRVREAPPPLRGEVDDLLKPRLAVYEGAALLYAARLPEELHAAAGALARRAGADLALRLLGDEAPALPGWPAPEAFPDAAGPWLRWRRA